VARTSQRGFISIETSTPANTPTIAASTMALFQRRMTSQVKRFCKPAGGSAPTAYGVWLGSPDTWSTALIGLTEGGNKVSIVFLCFAYIACLRG
jgi:hypothetical protein